jgi:hypothetical protein
MDALVFDAEISLDLEAMPISRIMYWYRRAVIRAERRRAARPGRAGRRMSVRL